MPEKMSLEKLAQMVQRGFEQTATSIEALATKEELVETRETLATAIKDLDIKVSALASS